MALLNHRARNPHYDLKALIPNDLRAALRDVTVSRLTRLNLLAQLDALMRSTTHPDYHCATCKRQTRNSPVHVFALRDLVLAVCTQTGTDDVPDDGWQSVDWEDFFAVDTRTLAIL